MLKLLPFNPGDPARMMPDPARIMIAVSGGSGPISGALVQGNAMPDSDFVTTKIELPANWGKLVEKYKNIVPTYALF